ncbi:MAG: internal scaffolding protein [Arizlama microvirus]|nr:MAG: internal scaffolding protein [Arizlama microvirus]
MIFLEAFMSKSAVFLRTPYNYDTMEASDASALLCEDPSLAQQHARDECDINTIVRRFGLTGELPSNVRTPQYGDFLEASDYHTSLNAVRAADAAFMQLSADIRTRFNNDAGAFVDFVSDDSNRAEAEKLGLVLPTAAINPAPEQGDGVAQSST